MRRTFLTALIAGAVLFAIAGLPATSTDSVLTSFTSSAQAGSNLNLSKSNINSNQAGKNKEAAPRDPATGAFRLA